MKRKLLFSLIVLLVSIGAWADNLNVDDNTIIFADAAVKTICVNNWDTNGDGDLSYAEAAAVTDLGTVFKGNQVITNFNELQHFTGLTSIGEAAFWGCSGLTSITIPNSVTSIREYAFVYSRLTSIILPNSVTNNEEGAFRYCYYLTSITIPNSVTSIGAAPFMYCLSLKEIIVEQDNTNYADIDGVLFIKDFTEIIQFPCGKQVDTYSIPNSVKIIGDGAFSACNGLSSIEIPNSVTTIRGGAFYPCTGLTSVTIPNSVTSIGQYAFRGCTSLASIIIENGNTKYDSRDNCNAIIHTASNRLLLGCMNTVIPNSVTAISSNAFSECTGLTSIIIPNSVTSIEYAAFSNCSSLTSITIPNSVTSIESSAFSHCSGLTEVRSMIEESFAINDNVFSKYDIPLFVPAGTKALYEATDGWKNFSPNIVEMADSEPYAVLSNDGNTVTFYYDGNKASRGGTNINSNREDYYYSTVTTAVFDASFAEYRPTSTAYWLIGCSSLTTITGIEYLHTDNVTDMQYMFADCKVLTNLDVSGFKTDNVTNMKDLFKGCRSLTSLNVSGFKTNNVTNMVDMFCDCRSLTNLDVSGFNTTNVTDMGCMFAACSNLTSLDVSGFNTSNVTGMFAMFERCSGLTTIYAGNGWSTIKVTRGDGMFYGCTSLVGGKGTAYDESHTDYTYARIDGGTENPGYFTDIVEMEVEDTETVTVGDALVAGFSSNKNLDFTSLEEQGVSAWIATGFRGGNVLLSRVYAVSAGEGAYVKAEKAGTYEIPTTTEEPFYMNMFVGVPDGATVNMYEDFYGETYLTLSLAISKTTGKPGFFPNTAPKTYAAGKMYLHMPARLLPEYATTRLNEFSLGIEFEDDETTGISDAERLNDKGQMINGSTGSPQEKRGGVYNLNGQRLVSPRKGLNIIGGKKVVIK